MRRTLFWVTVIVAAAGCPGSAAPAFAQRTVVQNTNLTGLPEGAEKTLVRPSSVRYVGQAKDSFSFAFSHLRWTHWGTAHATGRGTVKVCGDDACATTHGTLTLSRLTGARACGAKTGDRIYTRAGITSVAPAAQHANAILGSVEEC